MLACNGSVRAGAGKAGGNAVRRATGLVCEELEARINLMGVDIGIDDGLTEGFDHIIIFRHDGNTTSILLAPNDVPLKIIYIGLGEPIILRPAGGNDIIEMGINGSYIEVYGGDGDDFVDARYQVIPMVFWGGEGNDRIDGGEQKTTVYGEGGNDTVNGGVGKENVDGGAGDDSLLGADGDDTLVGGAGHDTLRGGGGDDTLQGGDGDDNLHGNLGDDKLYGQDGNDTLLGGDNDGNDMMHGGNDTDRVDYSAKTTPVRITLEHTDETIAPDLDGVYTDEITSNVEIVIGGSANDFLKASQTASKAVTLRGGAGNDTLEGGLLGDSLSGENGDDEIDGNAGSDILRGGAGYDAMYGESGDDTLFGRNQDDDLFNGGSGIDLAELDLLPNDPETNLLNVETKSRG